LNQWPQQPSWEFVSVGRGHGVQDFWVPFLRALHAIDPDMAVNIEHEDQEFDQVEGLRMAAENLLAAARTAGI
jgi:sugar phosphate isomerase/epimerase